MQCYLDQTQKGLVDHSHADILEDGKGQALHNCKKRIVVNSGPSGDNSLSDGFLELLVLRRLEWSHLLTLGGAPSLPECTARNDYDITNITIWHQYKKSARRSLAIPPWLTVPKWLRGLAIHPGDRWRVIGKQKRTCVTTHLCCTISWWSKLKMTALAFVVNEILGFHSAAAAALPVLYFPMTHSGESFFLLLSNTIISLKRRHISQWMPITWTKRGIAYCFVAVLSWCYFC